MIATSAHLLPSRPSSRSRSLSPTNRKSQPGARNPASLQDFEGVPLKRQTENRERNLGLTALSQPPARGWRSRSRRAKPRQHWGTDEKKPTDSGWFLEFWWPGTESNRRHGDFQSPALPTELPGREQDRHISRPPVESATCNPGPGSRVPGPRPWVQKAREELA